MDMEDRGNAGPAGRKIEEDVVFDGISWNLHYARNRSTEDATWELFTFFAPAPGGEPTPCIRDEQEGQDGGPIVCAGQISVRRYLRHIIDKGMLSDQLYIADFEFGNELYGDCRLDIPDEQRRTFGKTLVNTFKVRAQKWG